MKITVIILSVLSILDLIVAIVFGAGIHSYRNVAVYGTYLLEIHITQGIGAAIITTMTLVSILLWKETNEKTIMVVASLLCMIGMAFSLLSGWFIYKHDGMIATLARFYHFHGIQVISTTILTFIILLIGAFSGRKKRLRLSNEVCKL